MNTNNDDHVEIANFTPFETNDPDLRPEQFQEAQNNNYAIDMMLLNASASIRANRESISR